MPTSQRTHFHEFPIFLSVSWLRLRWRPPVFGIGSPNSPQIILQHYHLRQVTPDSTFNQHPDPIEFSHLLIINPPGTHQGLATSHRVKDANTITPSSQMHPNTQPHQQQSISHRGNVCPARARRATFVLTIPTSAPDLPSHGEAPQVDHIALHTFPTKHVAK